MSSEGIDAKNLYLEKCCTVSWDLDYFDYRDDATMEITFKCPECQGKSILALSDGEAAQIKERIRSEGRSPTLIVRCENDHELLVTLYNPRTGDSLGVRDVVVPHRSGEDDMSKKTGSKEVDWLAKAFGGEHD